MTSSGPDTVFPAQAGIQGIQARKLWIPACAGMTTSTFAGMTTLLVDER